MNTANEVLLSMIKDLRHALVLQCEALRTDDNESIDLNIICNSVVAAEILMAFIVDKDESDLNARGGDEVKPNG